MATDDEFPARERETGGKGGSRTEGSVRAACLQDADTFVVELVTFVAQVREEDPMDLPALGDVIDPEAVQRLLASAGGGPAAVSFQYAGCEVAVTGSGAVVVRA